MGTNKGKILKNVYLIDENDNERGPYEVVVTEFRPSLMERIRGFIRWITFKLMIGKKYHLECEIIKEDKNESRKEKRDN